MSDERRKRELAAVREREAKRAKAKAENDARNARIKAGNTPKKKGFFSSMADKLDGVMDVKKAHSGGRKKMGKLGTAIKRADGGVVEEDKYPKLNAIFKKNKKK